VKEGSFLGRLSSKEPEPPAADMARLALRFRGRWTEEKGKVDHMTHVDIISPAHHSKS